MKKRINRFIKDNLVIISGVVILIVIHMIVMVTHGYAPFGDKVYLRGDNVNQLSGYAVELKRKIANHDGLFYTWKVTGGGSFYYIFSYALCSVFMLPLILCDIESFSSVLDFNFVVVSLLMYLTMNIYLVNKPTECKMRKKSPYLLIFSLAYAFLPALVNAGTFYPYLGCFVVMPLVLLGLEEYVANGNWILYFVSLAIVVMTNFYIGVICCAFIVMYYLTLSFQGFKYFVECSIRVLLVSVCAVGIAGIIIVPVILSTTDGGYGVSDYQGGHMFTSWFYIVKQSMWGRTPVLVGSAPEAYWECNTYIGILLSMLCLLYFFEAKIELNVRIRKLVVLLVLFLTFNESTANYIMHVFHYTVGIPNRQAVIVMLYMIIMAEEAGYYLINVRLTFKRFMKIMFITMSMSILFLVSYVKYYTEDGMLLSFMISLALVIIYSVVLMLVRKIKKRKILTIFVLFIVIVEIVSDYVVLYSNTNSVDVVIDDKYQSVVKLCNDIDDKGWYNIGYNGQDTSVNLGLLCGYNTLQGYSTVIRYGYIHALDQLGLRVTTNIREQGFNSFLNSVFNRKYLMEPSGAEYKYTIKDEIFRENRKIASYNNVDLYSDENILSPIIVAEGDLTKYEEYLRKEISNRKDVAKANNIMCEELSGVTGLMTTVSADALRIESVNNCNAMIYDDYLVFSPKLEEGTINLSEKSSVVISFKAPIEGEYIVNTTSNSHVGYHEAGDVVYAKAQISPSDYNQETGVYATDIMVNVLDYDKYKEAYEVMQHNCMNIAAYNSDRIEGTIVTDKCSEVFTSIPYDSSWNVYVDGVKTETKGLGDAFLTFEVEQGKHDIVLNYKPKGLLLGCVVSIVNVLVFIVMVVAMRKRT